MALGVVEQDLSYNLITASRKTNTSRNFLVLANESVVYGEALKLTAGKLVKVTATTDVIFAIALEASTEAVDNAISVMISGSVMPSGITFAVGTIDDFRESFVRDTQIVIEEQ